MLVHDVIWDDNCWLLSKLSTTGLDAFLNTGFYELRRVPLGTFNYFYYSLFGVTDGVYLVWDSLLLVVQTLTPFVLYLFVRNLSGMRLPAFFVSVTFIVVPVDTTLPFYSITAYRLGTLLSILSFYLTERGLSQGFKTLPIAGALAAALLSHSVFIEGAIALEPARLLLIWHLLSKEQGKRGRRLTKAIAMWTPFILICLPLVYHKLAYKPYGAYSGIYGNDYRFFFNIEMHRRLLRHFRFYNWLLFYRMMGVASMWPALLGIGSLLSGLWISRRLAVAVPEVEQSFGRAVRDAWRSSSFLLLLGLALMVPVMMMYEFAGRVPAPGQEGRHAVVMLFGYATVLGSMLYFAYRTLLSIPIRPIAGVLVALFIGAGVFFHNVNLDIFEWGREQQKSFWREFTARFPVLPEKAVFFIDARGEDFLYHYSDLEAYYELEFPLNLLYARSTRPEEFRNYIVYPLSDGVKEEWKAAQLDTFIKPSHLQRTDVVDPKEFIVLRHRAGEKLLVNQEILRYHPDVSYRMLADKEPPDFRGPVPEYPLRHKIKGFYVE